MHTNFRLYIHYLGISSPALEGDHGTRIEESDKWKTRAQAHSSVDIRNPATINIEVEEQQEARQSSTLFLA